MVVEDSGHIRQDEIRYIEKIAKRLPDEDLSYSKVFQPIG